MSNTINIDIDIIGESIVYNSDCIAGMKEYPDKWFDLAIVDPPYGINYDGEDGLVKNGKVKRQNGTYGVIKRQSHTKKDWDKEVPREEYFLELFRVSKNQIIWGGNYFFLPPTKGIICWDKKQMLPTFSRWELAWSSFNKPAKMIVHDNRGFLNNEPNIHPTQKPAYVYDWLLLNYAEKGQKILDTHLGSGSSRIAAHKNGFHFVGFEIDQEYFDKQEKRFKDFTSQTRLFK